MPLMQLMVLPTEGSGPLECAKAPVPNIVPAAPVLMETVRMREFPLSPTSSSPGGPKEMPARLALKRASGDGPSTNPDPACPASVDTAAAATEPGAATARMRALPLSVTYRTPVLGSRMS